METPLVTLAVDNDSMALAVDNDSMAAAVAPFTGLRLIDLNANIRAIQTVLRDK